LQSNGEAVDIQSHNVRVCNGLGWLIDDSIDHGLFCNCLVSKNFILKFSRRFRYS